MFLKFSKWLKRVHHFNQQMFPFFPNVFIFIIQFSISYLTIYKFFNPKPSISVLMLDIFTGSISLVLFAYLFRCFDEVKDYEDDKINFPNRPLVTGIISVNDMYLLQFAIAIILLILNLLIPSITTFTFDRFIGFISVFLFTVLASRWFFAKQWIKPSLPLALLTHNPVVYLHQLYILSFFELSNNTIFSPIGLILLSIALPGTAWEISRKIRGRNQEDSYTTYSKIWGIYKPLILILGLLTSSLICSFLGYFNSAIKSNNPSLVLLIWFIPLFAGIHFLYDCIKFWKNPDWAPDFRNRVENFIFAKIIVLILAYLML